MDPLEIRLRDSMRRWAAPIAPPPAFVRSLRSELVGAARQRYARNRRAWRLWLVGAAILGSLASVGGVTAFLLLRRRARMQPRPA